MSESSALTRETLKIKYESEEALPVFVLGKAFTAIGEDFQNFARQTTSRIEGLSERDSEFLLPVLVINHADEGSLTVWLSVQYAQIKGWIAPFSIAIGYVKRLQGMLDYFTGKSKDKPQLTLKELQTALPLILPNVSGFGSPLLIEAKQGDDYLRVAYGKEALRAADNRIKSEIVARESASASNIHSKVLFYWYRATFDPNNRSGERGIIEEISKKPIRTYIDDPAIKSKMLEGALADRSYLVTVRVSTKQDSPQLYHILDLHDVVE